MPLRFFHSTSSIRAFRRLSVKLVFLPMMLFTWKNSWICTISKKKGSQTLLLYTSTHSSRKGKSNCRIFWQIIILLCNRQLLKLIRRKKVNKIPLKSSERGKKSEKAEKSLTQDEEPLLAVTVMNMPSSILKMFVATLKNRTRKWKNHAKEWSETLKL